MKEFGGGEIRSQSPLCGSSRWVIVVVVRVGVDFSWGVSMGVGVGVE